MAFPSCSFCIQEATQGREYSYNLKQPRFQILEIAKYRSVCYSVLEIFIILNQQGKGKINAYWFARRRHGYPRDATPCARRRRLRGHSLSYCRRKFKCIIRTILGAKKQAN